MERPLDSLQLTKWIREHGDESLLGQGYQGQVYLYDAAYGQLVVKAGTRRFPLRWIFRKAPAREHRVYQRLDGFRGAPRCLGLAEGRYLVLERVSGVPFREASMAPEERETFFSLLWEDLQEMHKRGVAHGDLKRKENLLVVNGDRPCILDFGAAVIRPQGFSPVQSFLFKTLRQFDDNAWVKLKYGRQLQGLTPEDAPRYRRTWVERSARWIKKTYLRALGRWPYDD
jgi:predicted Ser/Thr protein kinase